MQTYQFTLILDDVAELTDAMADRLYTSGCDDGTPGSSEGVVSIRFNRDAASLESALRTAVGDVQAAGHRVARIEFEPHELARPA